MVKARETHVRMVVLERLPRLCLLRPHRRKQAATPQCTRAPGVRAAPTAAALLLLLLLLDLDLHRLGDLLLLELRVRNLLVRVVFGLLRGAFRASLERKKVVEIGERGA